MNDSPQPETSTATVLVFAACVLSCLAAGGMVLQRAATGVAHGTPAARYFLVGSAVVSSCLFQRCAMKEAARGATKIGKLNISVTQAILVVVFMVTFAVALGNVFG